MTQTTIHDEVAPSSPALPPPVPSPLVVAPLCGRGSVSSEVAAAVFASLPRLLERWLCRPVVLAPYLGASDLCANRSLMLADLAAQPLPSTSLVLLLDDDILISPRMVAALVELQGRDGGTVGLDYMPRGWHGARPCTVSPVTINGGRHLVGAGCLLVPLGAIRKALKKAAEAQNTKTPYLSTSTISPLKTDAGEVVTWLPDDYSLCVALGGVALLPGVFAHHMASGESSEMDKADNLLASLGLGDPRG